MRRHVFEANFCDYAARRVVGGREVRRSSDPATGPCCASASPPTSPASALREIAPTLPQERHELVPIAREDVKLDELAAIADIEDTEIRVGRSRPWRR